MTPRFGAEAPRRAAPGYRTSIEYRWGAVLEVPLGAARGTPIRDLRQLRPQFASATSLQ